MSEKHPGGISLTQKLIRLSGISPCHILDMGAGDGHSVRFLKELGFQAEGIDLVPDKDVSSGNFLFCPFPDESFDAILSECSFYISGDSPTAIKEAVRLLKPGGKLLLADVSFLAPENFCQTLEEAGLSVLHLEDYTQLWKEYYISCIWNGTADELCPLPSHKGKCSYYLTVCERRTTYGRI